MSVFHGSLILQYLFYLLSLTEITLDQTKNELEKIKQEKIDLETKLQLFKSSDVSILTTAKNRMEKKYHEKDLELAKTIGKKYAIVACSYLLFWITPRTAQFHEKTR